MRNLVVESHAMDQWYSDLSASDANVPGDLIACSAKWIAFSSQHGGVDLLSVAETGRTKPRHVKGRQVVHLAFSPHDPDIWLACTESGQVILYRIEEELGSMDCGSTKLKSAVWNPSADGVVAVLAEDAVHVWDVLLGEKLAKTQMPDLVVSGAWTTCETFACLNENGSLWVGDLRGTNFRGAPEIYPDIHRSKAMRVVAGIDENTLVTTGVGMSREREVAYWNLQDMTKPMNRTRVDTGNGTLVPIVVNDMSLLLVQARGETSIKAYELNNETCFFLSNNILTQQSMLGTCVLPVVACDVMDCEIARVLRLTQTCITTIKCEVPRRIRSTFHAELFPDTVDITKAALTRQEWMNGANGPPLTISVLDLIDAVAGVVVKDVDANVQQEEEEEEVYVEEQSLPYEETAIDKRFSKRMGYIPKMKYAKADQVKKDLTLFNLKPAAIPVLAACGSKFALSWSGGGGPVYVGSTTATGKLDHPENEPVLNGHSKPVMSLAFNPFNDNILASGSDDCHIKIWNEDRDIADLNLHQSSVRNLLFHPSIDGILLSGGQDCFLRLWDISVENEITGYSSSDPVVDMDWNYDGSLIAAMWRSNSFDVIDPRSNCTIGETTHAHNGAKPSFITWLGDSSCVLTSGFNKLGARELNVWDTRKPGNALSTARLGMGGSTSFQPLYVEDNGVVVLGARGETTMLVYEVEGMSQATMLPEHISNPFDLHKCNPLSLNGLPTTALAMLPRRACDTSRTEWAKIVRLSTSVLEPLHLTVPRATDLLDYFADDIYGKTRASIPAAVSVTEWTAGVNEPPVLMEMNECTKSKRLSQRDPALAHQAMRKAKENSDVFRRQREEEDRKKQDADNAFERMQHLAVQHEAYNPNLSKGGVGHHEARAGELDTGNNDVADDEWGDD